MSGGDSPRAIAAARTVCPDLSISTVSDTSNGFSQVLSQNESRLSIRERRASIRKTGDYEFFHMTYLANLLTNPHKNKLI